MQKELLEKSEDRFNPRGNGRANGRTPFLELLDEYDFPRPQKGDILRGEILRIENDVVYVDVGSKRDALVPHSEVQELDDDLLEALSTGDEVPVYVTRTPLGDQQLIVSLERGLQELDWERAEVLEATGETIELQVIGHNKGGLVVEFGRVRGFVPNSHVPKIRNLRNKQEQLRQKAQMAGSTLPLKIIEVNSQRDRLVLSATAAQREQRQQQLQALQPGEVITGEVINLKSYGAFIDLGQGVVGLLHISKIAWEHIDHPSSMLSEGDTIEVLIDDVDIERERVSLNRKALLPGPWEQFTADHEVGDLLPGQVTAVVDFGAFVGFPEGVEGLLHKNEIHLPPHGDPADVLKSGDEVLVRVTNIEPKRQRLGLSMRRVSAAEELEWMAAKQEEEVPDQSDTNDKTIDD